MHLETSFFENLAIKFASRLTSFALRIPPFGASSTLRQVSNFNGSIRGILIVKYTHSLPYRLVYFIDMLRCFSARAFASRMFVFSVLTISLSLAMTILILLLSVSSWRTNSFLTQSKSSLILLSRAKELAPTVGVARIKYSVNYSPDTCPQISSGFYRCRITFLFRHATKFVRNFPLSAVQKKQSLSQCSYSLRSSRWRPTSHGTQISIDGFRSA